MNRANKHIKSIVALTLVVSMVSLYIISISISYTSSNSVVNQCLDTGRGC